MISVRNLYKHFGGVHAVNGISLEIRTGLITGLIGPNGAGKTTLFNLIAGIFPPDQGQILLDGEDVTGFKPHQLFSEGLLRTFQIPHEFHSLTVRENLMMVAKEIHTQYRVVEEDNQKEMEEAWDDVSGAELDPKLVKKARLEEIEYVKAMHFYTKVPISQCDAETKRAPSSVRWIDINEGDNEKQDYRSRVVAREINTYNREDFFAATPLLEALKILLS